MKINVVVVGTLKEKYLVNACAEYEKRINRFHQLNIVSIEEERLPKAPNEVDISKALVKEGLRIEKYLKGFIVALDINGKELDSVDFSKLIYNSANNFDTITFVIGGSYGLCDSIKNMAHFRLSFSKMTFPHQLFRVMLLEQIYRATTIQNNILYHK